MNLDSTRRQALKAWLSANAHTQTTGDPKRAVEKIALIGTFRPSGVLLWRQLVRAEALAPLDGHLRARLVAEKLATAAAELDAGVREDVVRWLRIHGRAIQTPGAEPRFQPQSLREGWLELRRNPEPTS